MTRKSFWVGIGILLLIIAGVQPTLAQSDPDEPGFPPELLLEPHVPGTVEGTGTSFQVTDSEYLNITLESTQPVKLRLESIPRMVIMDIEAAGGAASTELTLGGFPPSTTFYKYEDDYHNGMPVTTDVNGSYAYIQDLSQPHHVFIQPDPSTRYIPSDTEIGTWDAVNRVYTLTKDVSETIQIDEDNLTLDGVGHMVTGLGSGYGVYADGKTDILMANLNVQGFSTGLCLLRCASNEVTSNNFSNNVLGITLQFSDRNNVEGNSACNNGVGIYLVGGSDDNVLRNNIASNNEHSGVWLSYFCCGNTLMGNTSNANSNAGIYMDNDCENNSFVENTASWNDVGVYALDCSHDNLRGNTASNNSVVGVSLGSCEGITLTRNTISSNGTGLSLWLSRVKAYNNNFIGNATQVRNPWFTCVFNLDRPIGGNYWSDWTGPDTDGDGFVDLPYVLPRGQDDLPLTLIATDVDSDGIAGHVEDAAPNGGDGNKDGILDSEQANVASLPNAEDGRFVTLESPGGTELVDVLAADNPSPDDAPAGVAFPVGFFEFRVQGITPGGSTTVTLYPPQKVDTFYKYGPEPGNPTDHWFEFLFDGTTGAEILAGEQVVLHFVDGQRGDYDLQANGEIVEPGAVGIFPRTWLGFLPPLEPENKRLFKRGSTIPVKFRISDPEGMPVTDAYATLAVYYLGDGAPAGEPEVESTAAGDWGNQFRYSPEDDLYIFNLSTKDTSFLDWFTYELVVTLDDGQTHVVDFSLK